MKFLPIRPTASVSRILGVTAKSLLVVLALLVGVGSAHAATQTAFVVTNSGDTTTGVVANCQTATLTATSCGLRDAIAAASAVATSTTPATITFSATVFTAATTITETRGLLTLPAYTTVTGLTSGTGATLTNLITINGGGLNAVFQTNGLGSALKNLIITNGSAAAGGGIYVNSSTALTITQCTISNSKSTSFAGGIYIGASGTLTITQSTISGNTASTLGAGIYNAGTLTMSASTVSGNTTSTSGGGIYTASGTVSLTHVTLNANKATTTGGGIYVAGGTAAATTSVIAGNSATGSYADIYGTVTATTSLVNISSATTTPLAYQPSLAALGSYGGPTQTSPVIPTPISGDTIAFCYVSSASAGTAYTDQRGVAGWTNYNGTYCSDAGATESSFAVSYFVQPAASYVVNALMGATTAPSLQFTDDTLQFGPGGSVVFTDTGAVIAGTTTVALTGALATPSAASFKAVYGADQLIGTYTLTLPNLSTAGLTATSTPFNVVATTTVGLTITSPITYGTTLAGLTPTATFGGSAVPGVFTYTATISGGSPVKVGTATALTPGTYVITATFTPTNATLYSTGTASAALVVNKATPVIVFTQSAASIFVNNTVTLTASGAAVGAGVFPTGTVNFTNNSVNPAATVATANFTPVGSTSNTAIAPYTPSSSGAESLTAVYLGDSNYNAVSSTAFTEGVVDFSLLSSIATMTTRGNSATSTLTLTPIGGTTFPGAITLSVSGLPAGVTATLSPVTIASGATSGTSTLSVSVPSSFAQMEIHHGINPRVNGLAPIAFALLLLPFAGRLRKSGKRFRAMMLVLLLSVGVIGSLTGCSTKLTPTEPEDIQVTVTGTNGTATHSITVIVVVD